MGSKKSGVAVTDAEGGLRLQRDDVMNILEALTDGIYIVNRDCDIEYVNPVIEREFGKVAGRKCYAYFHDRTEPCPWCKNETVFNGGSVRWEWHSEKTGKTYELFDTPIKNPDGTVSKLEIFHDITGHKKTLEALRQSGEMLEKTFSSLHEAVYLVDPRSRTIIYANSAAERIFGYSLEEMLGKNTAFLYENEERYKEFGLLLFAAFEKEPVFNAEYQMRRKNGEIFEMEHTVSKVLDESGNMVNVVSVVRDITGRKSKERALRESEERYRAAFQASKAIELLIDPETGAITDANAAACRYYGYSRERLTSTFIYQINTLSHDEVEREMEAAKNEQRNYFNFRHRLASGEIRDVEVYSSPVSIKEKKILRSIIHDITARRAAEAASKESESRFRNYFDLGQVGMAITSLDQKWLMVNDRLCEMLGYTKDELTKMTWTELTYPDDLEPDLARFGKLLSGEGKTYSMDKRFLHKTGKIVNASIAVACQRKPDRSIDYFIASVEDITARKTAEEKLKAAKEEAEAATLLKDKFIALVAHDLKSPIGNSILALQHLRARLKEEGLPIADDPMLALSIGANQNMLRLIEDLLQMSRIKSGAISPRLAFTDAHYLFQYAADFNAGAAERKGVALVNLVPPRTRLYCDMKLSSEVVVNLISNAIKFSKKGDSITIAQKVGTPSVFFVKDAGVGIEPNRFDSLFKYEVPTSTTGTGGERGTGMGLPLSNELMKSQGGALQIESAPGKGTTVVVSFPHVAPKALVVEDSNFDMEIARMFLKDIGIKVVEAASGEEGLRLMETELPHLILLDVNLPDIDGFEVLRRKGANPQTAAIPLIVITGSENADIAEEAFRLGASDFIKKPLQPEILVARVRRIVS